MSDLRLGTLKAFNASQYTATVELVGGRGYYLADVPVSRAIASAEMVAGRTVYMLARDEANPTEIIVLGVR